MFFNDYNLYSSQMIVESKGTKAGVLCTVTGPFMEIAVKNRNDRIYSRSLVKNRIVEAPYTKEMISCNMLIGETKHPKDRFEPNFMEASHVVTDLWIDEEKNLLMGRADILDTPCGRVMDTFIQYGSKIGISARAKGETRKTKNGLEVIEDSYVFRAFDFVPLPGFAKSRLSQTNEGVEESLICSIQEQISSTDERDLPAIKDMLESVSTDYFSETIKSIDEKLSGSTSTSSKDSSPLDESLKELQSERDSLMEQVTNLEIDLERSIILNDVNIEKISKLEEELELRPTLEEYNEVKQSLSDLQESTKDMDDIRNKVKVLEDSNNKLAKAVSEQVKENLKLHSDLNESLRANEILADSVVSLSGEVSIYKERMDECNREYSEFRNNTIEVINESTGISIDLLEEKIQESSDLLSIPKFNKNLNKQPESSIKVVSVINESVDEEEHKPNERLANIIKNVKGGN